MLDGLGWVEGPFPPAGKKTPGRRGAPSMGEEQEKRGRGLHPEGRGWGGALVWDG